MLTLKSKNDYQKLAGSRYKKIGKYFLVVYMADLGCETPRAGITVSKKIGNAVIRNKVKRRIKAVLREFFLPVTCKSFLCNIIALSSVTSADWMALKNDLTDCLSRIVKEMRDM